MATWVAPTAANLSIYLVIVQSGQCCVLVSTLRHRWAVTHTPTPLTVPHHTYQPTTLNVCIAVPAPGCSTCHGHGMDSRAHDMNSCAMRGAEQLGP